jgi:hypothetical protein
MEVAHRQKKKKEEGGGISFFLSETGIRARADNKFLDSNWETRDAQHLCSKHHGRLYILYNI